MNIGICNRRAFTLVELLSVICIISLVAVFASDGLRSIVNGNNLDKALIGVSAAMENARQFAITKGTYTWVGLNSSKDPETGMSTITVATFASRDGTRGEGALPLQVISKTQKFELTALQSEIPATNRLSGSSQLPRQDKAIYANQATFKPTSDQLPPKFKALDFDWSVVFTPQGTACIDDGTPATGVAGATGDDFSPEEAICMVVSSRRGDSANPTENSSAAMIRINGVTGQVEVFQPQP
jgi:prepilin-type N-terminal cleavage/methylation domain-containing protein